MATDRQITDRAMRVGAASRGVSVSYGVTGDLPKFADAVRDLGEKSARKAYSRGVDHTGRKAQTQVVRALAKQVGLPQKRLKALGRIQFKPSRNFPSAEPQARIESTGRFLPLSEFKPRQFRQGAKASPWGRRELFEGSFTMSGNWRSGKPMPRGWVYRNSGKFNPKSGRNNLPAPIWGPAIPREMVAGDSAAAFATVLPDLRTRIAHEVGRLTKGVVT